MVAVSIIVGALIAVFSGMGVGGGGLFAVYLSVFTDVPQLAVQGYNLLFFLFSSGASVTVQLFRSRIRFWAVMIMIVTGIAGALVGTALTGVFSSEWLRRIFGIMLVSGGIVSLKKYSQNRSTKNACVAEKTTADSSKECEK